MGKFLWGASTASYQIEGAAKEGGRGESIWDRFSHVPGNIKNGDTGDVACDHYHRFEEDVELMKELGIDAYRFSLAWPRIVPADTGSVNREGLEFYRRLITKLRDAGIRPLVTLFHWDLPQPLEDTGGWANRDTVKHFADYVATVVDDLSDVVSDWITLNEPWCSAVSGYSDGVIAPGRREPPVVMAQVIHNHLLAHGHAVKIIRDLGAKNAEVGISINPIIYLPHTPEDVEATDNLWAVENGWWFDALYNGEYPGTWRNETGALPEILDGDMALISAPTDFLGLNIYTGIHMTRDASQHTGMRECTPGDGDEVTGMGWRVTPEVIYDTVEKVSSRYPVGKIYITENGSAYPDVVSEDGCVHDPERISFLERYTAQAMRAVKDGLPLAGYFAWSFMDNFEWIHGYDKRFGLIYVDYANGQKRIKKDSFYRYQEMIRTGR